MDSGNIKKYQNNGVVASVPSTSPHFNLQQSQQLAQQPGAGMPSTQINNVVAAAVAATVAAAAPTIPASVTTASVAASVTPMVSATVPVVSAHASSNDNLTKAATDATPTASINPEATPSQTNQYQNHPQQQHRHNQRDQDNYNSGGFSSYPRGAPMESIQGGKEMQK